jgi:hypothetical protein
VTTYTLFGQGAHATVNSSTGTQFIAGIEFEVTAGGCWLEGYWWRAGGATAAQKFCLYCVTGGTSGGTGSKTGTVVTGSVVTSGTLTANAWNYVPLASPLPLAIGTAYVAATGYTIVAPFANQSNVFNSAGTDPNGITNGPLFAYNDSAGGGPAADNNPWGGWSQAVFATGAGTDPTAHLPTAGSNFGSFGMDVQISDTDPTGTYSGPYRLWPNNIAANVATVLDQPEQYVIGTVFTLSQACTLNNTWFYSPPGSVGLPTKADIWRVSDQANVATMTPSWSGSAGSGWVPAAWSGVTLPAGTYVASVYNANATGTGNGWSAKDATTNYWATGRGKNGITWGPLSAPSLAAAPAAFMPYPGGGAAAPGQNVFQNVSTGPDQFPSLYVTGLAQVYWVDVAVTPVPPDSGSGGVAVVKPSLAAAGAQSFPGSGGVSVPALALSGAGWTTITGSGGVALAKPSLAASAPAVPQQTGSWWGLYNVLREQAEYAQYYRSQPPVACPNDGTPLLGGPPQEAAVLFCPFDGWQWPRDYDPAIHSGM